MLAPSIIEIVFLVVLLLLSPITGNETIQKNCDTGKREEALKRAFRFLEYLFDPSLDLLPEYPGAKVYWLYHDNYLASKILKPVRPDITQRIEKAIHHYGVTYSGKIEILFGEAKHPLPFRIPELVTVAWKGPKQIRTERITNRILKDWQEYSDLLFLAGIAQARTQPQQAIQYFRQALEMWDGRGFYDRVAQNHHLYSTYKLALALLAARKLKQPLPMREEILTRLLRQQDSSGGFITDYNIEGQPVGLPNVETTCLVILALSPKG